MILLHHYNLDFTCCELCAYKRLAVNPEEFEYVYSVELYPHETITCNDCDEEVKGEDEDAEQVLPFPNLNQYK
jgi:hypothetical protein